jgi:hypothetical protein
MMMIYPADKYCNKANYKGKEWLPIVQKEFKQTFTVLRVKKLNQFQNQKCNGNRKNTIAERL